MSFSIPYKLTKIVFLLLGITSNGISVQEDYMNAQNGTSTGVVTNQIPIYGLTLTNITGTITGNARSVYIFCAAGGCFDFNWTNVTITPETGVKSSSCNFAPTGDFVC